MSCRHAAMAQSKHLRAAQDKAEMHSSRLSATALDWPVLMTRSCIGQGSVFYLCVRAPLCS